MNHFIAINQSCGIPKKNQLITALIKKITSNNLKAGDKLPSINELSNTCNLSRDTVERAYKTMKDRKIIKSVRGKGYFVEKTHLNSEINILFLVNKSSSYKMMIYNSFVKIMRERAQVQLVIYHCEESLFIQELERSLGSYNYYVILPHFKDGLSNHVNHTSSVLNCLNKIPKESLVFLDNHETINKKNIGSVYQDFENDIFNALLEAKDKLEEYEKLIIVFPKFTVYPYPKKILKGFYKFCTIHNFDFEVLEEIYEDMELNSKDMYVSIRETDLVNLVRQIRKKKMVMGRDIGVISYNDTPLKELLGISVISTDFKIMGETAAYMILKRKQEHVKNVFRYIERNSV